MLCFLERWMGVDLEIKDLRFFAIKHGHGSPTRKAATITE